jgi:hypothetical protein
MTQQFPTTDVVPPQLVVPPVLPPPTQRHQRQKSSASSISKLQQMTNGFEGSLTQTTGPTG